MTDHAHELRRHANKVGRPAGDTPAVMHAAAAYIEDLERRLREADARVAELEAERAEREKQDPAAWLDASTYDRPGCMVWLQDDLKGMDTTNLAPLYVAPPVTAPAVGYVNALRYIAWEAAGYMDCVHAAKQAIGETGALPLPPNTQPARGEG